LRRARKVAWAAARSSSSPRLAQSRPRRGRGWQALVVVAGPRRTSGAPRGARWQGMQAGGPGQAGRQAGRRLRAERRAHAPLPTAAAVGGGWVARQAAPYSALNDWHGLFCCRPRFPRLRAVLAVARTARACCARACCCALARRAGARPTTPPARVMAREAGRRRRRWWRRRLEGASEGARRVQGQSRRCAISRQLSLVHGEQ
jgi:hypothetical protein